jgi:predicted nucleotidyltransferase
LLTEADVHLAEAQLAKIRPWAEASPYLDAVRLFGSYAKGNAHERSDIDLAVSANAGHYLALVDEWEHDLTRHTRVDSAHTRLSSKRGDPISLRRVQLAAVSAISLKSRRGRQLSRQKCHVRLGLKTSHWMEPHLRPLSANSGRDTTKRDVIGA